jgi:predicted RNA-binding Zn ribbon-like protein
MSGTPQAATLFDLCGGHPALDLVNSLDNRFHPAGPRERLASYGDLLRFLEESGLLSRERVRLLNKAVPPEAAERTLQSTRELREATAAVFYGSVAGNPPLAADVRVLEKHFLSMSRHRELQWPAAVREGSGNAARSSGRAALAWQWGRYEAEPDLPLWVIAREVSDLALSGEMARVRTCAVDTCRWLFLDTSKNHTRRWCNMRVCGNRMKARRFQARRED